MGLRASAASDPRLKRPITERRKTMEPIKVLIPRCLCPACCGLAARDGLETLGFIQVVLALMALESAIGIHGVN